jgi:plastocyanin
MVKHMRAERRSHLLLGFLGLALVLTIALALGGCGSEQQESTSSITTQTTTAVESTLPSVGAGANAQGTGAQIVIQNGKLNQTELVIPVGTAVTFVNQDDDTTKTYDLATADGAYDTGSLAESDSSTITFQKAGSFTFSDKTSPAITCTITVQ